MANIFSGLFGGGNNAAALAKYNYDLKRQKETQDYIDRNQDLMGQKQAFETAIQKMSPERQNIMRYNHLMSAGRTTGDKGLEGIAAGLRQRGDTISGNIAQKQKRITDRLKEEEKIKAHQKKWDYELENMKPNERKRYAEYLIELGRKDPKNAHLSDADVFRKLAAQEKMLKTNTGYQSQIDPNKFISLNIEEGAFLKAAGSHFGPQYFEFPRQLAATDSLINGFERKQRDVQTLLGITSDSALGWQGLALAWAPGADAHDWELLKETVVNNIGLDQLMEAKESSGTGASGFGQLSNQELALLQGILGNLKNTSDPERIKVILRDLDNFYARMKSDRKRKIQRMHRENINTANTHGWPEHRRYQIDETYNYLLDKAGAKQPSSTAGSQYNQEKAREEIFEEGVEQQKFEILPVR